MTANAVAYGPRRRLWRETLSEMAVIQSGALLVTPPSCDPLQRQLSFPSGITAAAYQVPSCGLTREEQDNAMDETQTILEKGSQFMFGYMCSQDFCRPRLLQCPLTSVMANAVGDPFTTSRPYKYTAKWVEQNVLDYFASLWNAKWPHDSNDPESYWGNVLTMGSSEGNIHSLWSARTYLTTHSSADDKSPVVFFSQNSNFSLKKLVNILKLKRFDEVGREWYSGENPLGGEWVSGVPCTGGSTGPGTIDINALEKLVNFFSERGHPIIVVFNYGTTLKGACDDVKGAGERLVKILKTNNMYERKIVNPDDPSNCETCQQFWFHVDGALSAAYMPFLQMAYKHGLTDVEPAPAFDFRLDFVSSIVTSGHKYIGSPWPCGVYLTRNKLLCLKQQLTESVICSTDTTIPLSRNVHSSFLLWSYISSNSYDDQVASILRCLRLVSYTIRKMKELEKKIGLDLRIIHFPPSLSILFRQPNTRIVLKYTLTTSPLCVEGKEQPFAQVYIMKHITTGKVDSFICDLEATDAFTSLRHKL